MRTQILIALSTFLLAGCYSTSKLNLQPLTDTSFDQRLLLAVVDFQNQSGDANNDALIEGATGTVIYELQNSGRFRLMERKRLLSILDEQELEMGGLVDEEKAREVGKLLGVDALFFGNLSAVKHSTSKQTMLIAWTEGQKIEVSLDGRIVDVETGEIYASAKTSSFVDHRKWVAFWIFRLGGKKEKSAVTQTAIELACKQLVNDIVSKAPLKGTTP